MNLYVHYGRINRNDRKMGFNAATTIVIYGPPHAIKIIDKFLTGKAFSRYDDGTIDIEAESRAMTVRVIVPEADNEPYLFRVISIPPNIKVYRMFNGYSGEGHTFFERLLTIFIAVDLYSYYVTECPRIDATCAETGVITDSKYYGKEAFQYRIDTQNRIISKIFMRFGNTSDYRDDFPKDEEYSYNQVKHCSLKRFQTYECSCNRSEDSDADSEPGPKYTRFRHDIHCPKNIGPGTRTLKYTIRPMRNDYPESRFFLYESLSKIEAYIKSHESIMCTSLISILLREDSLDALKLFVRANIKPTEFDCGINPLMIAVKVDKVEEFNLLFTYLPEMLDSLDEFDRSILHYCVLAGNKELFRLLVPKVQNDPKALIEYAKLHSTTEFAEFIETTINV